MTKYLDKEQLEVVVMQMIWARPYSEINGNKIYSITALGEQEVVKNLSGTKEVFTLAEFENAVNSPDVKQIFIDKSAAITSKGIKSVLDRTVLSKGVYCAFNFKG